MTIGRLKLAGDETSTFKINPRGKQTVFMNKPWIQDINVIPVM